MTTRIAAQPIAEPTYEELEREVAEACKEMDSAVNLYLDLLDRWLTKEAPNQ